MVFDETHLALMRQAVSHLDDVTEKRMFGGVCFLLHGNMLCGVHRGGGMARVGKDLEQQAIQCDGVDHCTFTGRPMGGIVELNSAAMNNEAILHEVIELAEQFVGSLPPK